ncbi:MAG: Uncharacterised protein [Owenweeksia sp. TMED14]|nr:MAG: Uncharacterised protein [Owenweeksia sp. TMED14]
MLVRRVVDPNSWIELVGLFDEWSMLSSNYPEKISDRFWKEINREFNRASRSDMESFLHTFFALNKSDLSISVRLYDDGQLSWWLLDGIVNIADYDSEQVNDSTLYSIKEGRLVGRFKNDSIEVLNVSGIYNPFNKEFDADIGRVEWLRAGFGPGELYADLGSWKINLSEPGFSVDTVTLVSEYYLREPILGFFEDRMTARNMANNAIFPKFEAFGNQLEISNFFERVDYKGGFSIIGQRFFASGTKDVKAHFRFWYDSSAVLDLRAERFVIRSDELISKDAEVSFKLQGDSLYHLKSNITYNPIDEMLRVDRPSKGLALTPFKDSYHNLVMDIDQIRWKTSEPMFTLGGINMGDGSPVTIESDQYFRSSRYSELQGLDLENPLVKIDEVGKTYGYKSIGLYQMAVGLGMPLESCERFLMELAIDGFVRYGLEKREVEVLPKTTEYILNNSNGRDYDVIRFLSSVGKGMNAMVSLLDFDMEVWGVRTIALSDSQKVALYPESQKVLIHKNLNFDFDGRIEAGRFTFYSRQNKFDYKLFRFNMPVIDSMKFSVPSFKLMPDGSRPLVRVRNTIENISGELLIDNPSNKSSYQRYPQYPIFKSEKSAKIFYDEAFDGVYQRDKFFVKIDPFEIDSLDNTSTEGLVFKGEFTSSGIFKTRRQDIRVQDDYSFGFTQKTGENGWLLYNEKGVSKGSVRLSISGLKVDGSIAFEKAIGYSSKFELFPDTVRGNGDFFLSSYEAPPRGAGHPGIKGILASMIWNPNINTWRSTNLDKPFDAYKDRLMTADGILTYTPGFLEIDGTLAFNDAELDGSVIRLFSKWVQSGSANFRVRESLDFEWSFKMNNAISEVDFVANKGTFQLQNGDETLVFPRNEYRANMDHAEWDIFKKFVSISKETNIEARLTSTHLDQGGLSFLSKSAKFYLAPSLLECFGVPALDVADSRIYPDSGRVTIEEKALMRPLINASMTASRVGKYHIIKNAELKVRGRNNLYGNGIYQYRDEDDVVWPIPMGRIDVDTLNHIVAQGEILPESEFYLSSRFKFYGIVNMESVEPMLSVKGSIHISAECPFLKTDWILTATKIDPLDIVIDLPDPDTARPARRVYSGIYLRSDSASPYTAFIMRNNSSSSVELFSSRGILFYDLENESFVVTTRRRLLDPEAPDNYLELNPKSCEVKGMGQLSLISKMGRVNAKTYGHIKYRLFTNRLSATASLNLDFLFSDNVLKSIPLEISSGLGGVTTNWANDYVNEALNRIMTQKDKNEYYAASTEYKMPKELRQTFVFDEIDFDYDKNSRAFRSKNGLGLGSVSGEPVHQFIDGVLELRKRRGGDQFSLYLNTDAEHFFYYKRNVLRYYSTDRVLIDEVLGIDVKKRSLPGKDGKPFYTFTTTSEGNMIRFLDGLDEVDDNQEN